MDKYSSVQLLKINGKEYNIHKKILKDISFFDDFLKQNNEIDIKVDNDITPEIVLLLIDNLYGNAMNRDHIFGNCLMFFKMFMLADYLCININYFKGISIYVRSYYLQKTFNYAYDKNLIDTFIKYIKYFKLCIPIETFDDHMDFKLMTQLIGKYDMSDMSKLVDKGFIDFVVENFKNGTIIKENRGYQYIQCCKIIEKLDKKNNAEDIKVIINFMVDRELSLGNLSKEEIRIKLYRDYCDEKVEIES